MPKSAGGFVCYTEPMQKTKVAINGFGRIGRAFLKIAWERPELEIVAVNDLGTIESLTYLLKYDTVYRTWKHDVASDGGNIVIDGKKVAFISEKDTTKLPWKELGVDVVVESTGLFTAYDKAKFHLDQGAKKVVISAPAKAPMAACRAKPFSLASMKRSLAPATSLRTHHAPPMQQAR